MEPQQRSAVRVLLVNDEGSVLLFRGFDPAEPHIRYWFTPGGGIDPAERSVAAAVRELREETGLALAPEEIGEPVHEDVTHFSFNGVSFRQEQIFYLVRVPRWSVDTTGFDEWEAETVDDHRWWSMEELAGTDETYYPRDLHEMLQRLGIVSC